MATKPTDKTWRQ